MSGLSSTPPLVSILSLEHEPGYVLGFPVHVALEVGLDREAAEARMVHMDCFSTNGALGAVLVDAAGQGSFARCSYQGDPEESPWTWLRSGRTRRLLVDVSEILPSRLPAGDYVAKIGVLGSSPPAWSSEFPLALRSPTDLERATLQRSQLALEETWGDWMCFRGGRECAWAPPPDPREPLRFSRLLREMLLGERALGDWTRQDLSVLHGVYAAEAEALWAEVLHARGDANALLAHCSAVAGRWPGLLDRLEEIQEGRGPVASLRAALA